MQIISREELKRLIDSKAEYVLIDVREKEELSYGMIPTAQNIPLHDLEETFALSEQAFQEKYGFAKPKKEGKVIFYCRTGGRSAMATQYAESIGYVHAENYAGSIYDWATIDPHVRRY
ncbi:MAG TPA: rhodanese-like domain-containing protein [Nanoarchaeota archaeon]|nr:rhodanese-like domain-containing protein [Candidatus Woesearchaeota archaeon]HIH14974.1 rhodanese-like domain-containing protein [Nanoarchaeota archaeon]HIH58779.1 rhodanese-like domain-containing protein [Nanoarchaeota archaeon]HIJ05317.1 rhodanese-like domain-containing protein [Nanoarchaeota archaeon]